MSIKQTLDDYYAKSCIDDGDLDENTVWAYAGPYFIKLKNSDGRKQITPFHDLHHIFSGYNHSRIGEGEAGAWELGSNCWNKPITVPLNIAGMGTGLLYSPKRIYNAFCRGSNNQNLYSLKLDGILKSTNSEVKQYINTSNNLKSNLFTIHFRFVFYFLMASISLILLSLYGFIFGVKNRNKG